MRLFAQMFGRACRHDWYTLIIIERPHIESHVKFCRRCERLKTFDIVKP